MRQGQQNRRGRGRGRKSQNPLSRNLESNGPDVKIRGTAAHIAEKYATLARDALSSGDTVAGESYLQHAEHYNRLIMANQQAQQGDAAAASGGGRGRGNGADRSDGEKQPEVPAEGASDDKASVEAASNDKVADDEGVARTIARSVKKSGNGAENAEDDSEPVSGAEAGDAEASKDEVVT